MPIDILKTLRTALSNGDFTAAETALRQLEELGIGRIRAIEMTANIPEESGEEPGETDGNSN